MHRCITPECGRVGLLSRVLPDLVVFQEIVRLVVGRLAEGERQYQEAYALRLTHAKSDESFWLHSDLSMYQVRQKYESLHPPDEWRYALVLFFLSDGN